MVAISCVWLQPRRSVIDLNAPSWDGAQHLVGTGDVVFRVDVDGWPRIVHWTVIFVFVWESVGESFSNYAPEEDGAIEERGKCSHMHSATKWKWKTKSWKKKRILIFSEKEVKKNNYEKIKWIGRLKDSCLLLFLLFVYWSPYTLNKTILNIFCVYFCDSFWFYPKQTFLCHTTTTDDEWTTQILRLVSNSCWNSSGLDDFYWLCWA